MGIPLVCFIGNASRYVCSLNILKKMIYRSNCVLCSNMLIGIYTFVYVHYTNIYIYTNTGRTHMWFYMYIHIYGRYVHCFYWYTLKVNFCSCERKRRSILRSGVQPIKASLYFTCAYTESWLYLVGQEYLTLTALVYMI